MNQNNISNLELNALNKVISYVGGSCKETISETETELAKECLKKFADNAPKWNDEQKKQFKSLVDLLQNPSKHQGI